MSYLSDAPDIDAHGPVHSFTIVMFWSMLGFRIPGADPFSQSVSSVQSVQSVKFHRLADWLSGSDLIEKVPTR